MNEILTPVLVPTATEGNLTNLIAERAWFEPERITMSRPLGEGWQALTAREVESDVRSAAKGLIAAGIQVGDRVAIMARGQFSTLQRGMPVASSFQSTRPLLPSKLIGFSMTLALLHSLLRLHLTVNSSTLSFHLIHNISGQ